MKLSDLYTGDFFNDADLEIAYLKLQQLEENLLELGDKFYLARTEVTQLLRMVESIRYYRSLK